MARIRYLKPKFFQNENLADLSFAHRLCYAGLWTQAERPGRLEDRPRRLKAAIFPYDDVDVDALLADLARAGFIRRYVAGGVHCLDIPTMAIHQRFRKDEPESALPPWESRDEIGLESAPPQPEPPGPVPDGTGEVPGPVPSASGSVTHQRIGIGIGTGRRTKNGAAGAARPVEKPGPEDASPKPRALSPEPDKPNTRLIAAVLRKEGLDLEPRPGRDEADIAEQAKRSLAEFGIPYDSRHVAAAIDSSRFTRRQGLARGS